jgi:hypothetical protein
MDPRPSDPEARLLENIGHPRGTLAIVIVFGVLLALGWFVTYASFIGRGAPHH